MSEGNIVRSDAKHPRFDMRAWRQAPDASGRAAAGTELRGRFPLADHAAWQFSPDRRDVIGLLEQQNTIRLQSLIPLRFSRMAVSPFTFYRGAAAIMANDLARTPVTGIPVQCIGDAHIGNFGIFYSPSKRLMFDVNDFDETTIGPWEWDIKRLAVSVEIAGRTLGLKESQCRQAVHRCVRHYRESIRDFASRGFLDTWYTHIDLEDRLDELEKSTKARPSRTLHGAISKAKAKDSRKAADRLTYVDNGRLRFRSDPPELVQINDLPGYDDVDALRGRLDMLLDTYRDSLYADRRHVLDQYHFEDIARKVVGVGSVGTRCWVGAFVGRDLSDPLILQMKEAVASVLAPYVGNAPYPTHGERVVQGQKLVQSTADILLGWAQFIASDGRPRDYYVRQLWNGKGSINLDTLHADSLSNLGALCAWCLAHAHARSGDSVAIGAYLGQGEEFDDALVAFSAAYADQNEDDFALFTRLIKSGELPSE